MARIFITGSSDGLGLLAARRLVRDGHDVVLHARNERRAQDTMDAEPKAEDVLIGDLASIEETLRLAENANATGRFDAVIHNAALYRAANKDILHVNTLAPYILTCLIDRPERLIYVSSGSHLHGKPALGSIASRKGVSYADSKLHVVMLAKAVARLWPEVHSNAVDPGWVPTKMGGTGAPDDLEKGFETQVWLAVGSDEKAMPSGRYLYHGKPANYRREADDIALQDEFVAVCSQVTGVRLPVDRE